MSQLHFSIILFAIAFGCILELEGTSAQITFEDEIPTEQKSQDEDLEIGDTFDYLDEILSGHRIRDREKFKRQHGCLCLSHLKDPHCGSDYKQYDNGCYFECAQKRNPRLGLRNWGPCL